jgi:O-acetyl-ADP-ribose deacetylase (regulator of RNase III)
MGVGGVDGAIHRAGGPSILEACREIVSRQGECKAGEAVVTTAGRLPADLVIHTVGPIWRGGTKGEAETLALCYENSLRLAVVNHCKSIAFPNISTGVYGFPKDKAADIAISTVKKFLADNTSLQRVVFVCFDQENKRLYDERIR